MEASLKNDKRVQSSLRKKVFSQTQEKLPVALYLLYKRYPQATTQFNIRDLTGNIISGKELMVSLYSTFCNAVTAPLPAKPNKRENMGIPQLLCREEQFPRVKNMLWQRT